MVKKLLARPASALAPGTSRVETDSVVTIHSHATRPSHGREAHARQDWTFTYSTPTTGGVKTLAPSGFSPTSGLALGYLTLVSGRALLAPRFVRRRGETG
jgi:hypothetical protein